MRYQIYSQMWSEGRGQVPMPAVLLFIRMSCTEYITDGLERPEARGRVNIVKERERDLVDA